MYSQRFKQCCAMILICIPQFAFAQSAVPAYATLGVGIVLMMALTLYVIMQIRGFIEAYTQQSEP